MVYHKKFVVSLKVAGKVLREIGDEVLLPLGTEYSIFLKNLESRKAVASITIDGQDVLNGTKVIVPANSSVELEGFMDASGKITHKFKFIEKTEQISEFRGDKPEDGLLRVEFTLEKEVIDIPVPNYYPIHIPIVKPYNPNPWVKPSPWKENDIPYGTISSHNLKSVLRSTSFNASGCDTESATYSSNASKDSISKEGITVKGSESNQKFVSGYTKVLEESSTVIVLKLKGTLKNKEVGKPLFVKDSLVCETCGDKNSHKNKFCANCGTALV